MTLERALALARQRAPQVLAAQARIDESRGRLQGASVWLRENPTVGGSMGWRTNNDGTGFLDANASLNQPIEIAGQRTARVESANADVARAEASRDDVSRRLLRDVTIAFCRALYARERVQLANKTEKLSAEVLSIAERRAEAGDLPLLDVNVSRAALSRARSEQRAAEALSDAAAGDLRLLLGLDALTDITVEGELKDRRRFELPSLMNAAPQRADLRALAAEREAAEAESRLGKAMAWPDVGLGVRYERDEGADVVAGTLSLTLPVFERGQGQRAEASARARRLGVELEASRRIVGVEIRTAFNVFQRRVAAVDELERGALPLLDDNETLARRSYESGQLGLADLLIVRREVLGTRLDYLDRLLEAAIAGAQLEASAGANP